MNIDPVDSTQKLSSATSASEQAAAPVSFTDSLSSSADYLPSKPKLAVIRLVTSFIPDVDKSKKALIDWAINRVKEQQAEVDDVTKQHTDQCLQQKKAQEGYTWWTDTSVLAGAATTAASFICGYYLMNSGQHHTLGRNMLIASAASAGASGLHAAGVCPRFTAALSLTIGITSLFLGNGPALGEIIANTENLSLITIYYASRILHAGSKISTARRQIQSIQSESEADRLSEKAKTSSIDLKDICDRIEEMMKKTTQAELTVSDLIQKITEQNRIITRQTIRAA